MLPSSKRLTIPLFQEVMDKGKLFHSTFMSAKFLKAAGTSRFSVAVSKKIAKTAVERNQVRRRTYTALRTLYEKIPPGFHGVLMMKGPAVKALLPSLVREVEGIFVKSGIIK